MIINKIKASQHCCKHKAGVLEQARFFKGTLRRSHCRWGRAFCPWGDADKCPVFLTLHFLPLHRSHCFPRPPLCLHYLLLFHRCFIYHHGMKWECFEPSHRTQREQWWDAGQVQLLWANRVLKTACGAHPTRATSCDISQKRRRIRRELTLAPPHYLPRLPARPHTFTLGAVTRHGDD